MYILSLLSLSLMRDLLSLSSGRISDKK